MVTRRSEPFRRLENLYTASGNPILVWVAVLICVQGKFDFPDWIRGYLGDTATRLSNPPATNNRDLGRALPSALGFDRSNGSKHSLKALSDLQRLERLAMEFAAHIFNGNTPRKARDSAANTSGLDDLDDKTIQAKLKRFFDRCDAPHDNAGWRQVLLGWMLAHPGYEDAYPKLPKTFSVMREYIERHPQVKGFNIIGDGSLEPIDRK
jgi:hypothetical protein